MQAMVLEVADRQVGLLIPARRGMVFRAAVSEAVPLDRARFNSVAAAETAVARLLRKVPANPRPDRRPR